jgi:ATP-dependent RNA helicase DBP3
MDRVSYLVLDEADRMLDQGFENDIRRIFAHCPGNDTRQTVMCKLASFGFLPHI